MQNLYTTNTSTIHHLESDFFAKENRNGEKNSKEEEDDDDDEEGHVYVCSALMECNSVGALELIVRYFRLLTESCLLYVDVAVVFVFSSKLDGRLIMLFNLFLHFLFLSFFLSLCISSLFWLHSKVF